VPDALKYVSQNNCCTEMIESDSADSTDMLMSPVGVGVGVVVGAVIASGHGCENMTTMMMMAQ